MRHIAINSMISVMCLVVWLRTGNPFLLFVAGMGAGTILAMIFMLVAIRKGGE